MTCDGVTNKSTESSPLIRPKCATMMCDADESIVTAETSSLIGTQFVEDDGCNKKTDVLKDTTLVVFDEVQGIAFLLSSMIHGLVGFDGSWGTGPIDEEPSVEVNFDGIRHTVVTSHPVDHLSFFDTEKRAVDSVEVIPKNGVRKQTQGSDRKAVDNMWGDAKWGKKEKTASVEVNYDGEKHTIVSSYPLGNTRSGQENIQSIDIVLPNATPLKRRKSLFGRSFHKKRHGSERGLPPRFPTDMSLKRTTSYFSRKSATRDTGDIPMKRSKSLFIKNTPTDDIRDVGDIPMKHHKSLFGKKRVKPQVPSEIYAEDTDELLPRDVFMNHRITIEAYHPNDESSLIEEEEPLRLIGTNTSI